MNTGSIFFKTTIILAALYGILFWLGFLWQRPGYNDSYASTFFFLPTAMIALALMMAIAAAKSAPKWVLGLSLVAFFPVGLYFLGGNSCCFSSVGYVYLVSMSLSFGWLYRCSLVACDKIK